MIWAVFGSLIATFGLGIVVVKVYYPWLLLDFKYIILVGSALSRALSLMKKRKFLVETFEEQVAKTPEKVFLLFENQSFTYQVTGKLVLEYTVI